MTAVQRKALALRRGVEEAGAVEHGAVGGLVHAAFVGLALGLEGAVCGRRASIWAWAARVRWLREWMPMPSAMASRARAAMATRRRVKSGRSSMKGREARLMETRISWPALPGPRRASRC